MHAQDSSLEVGQTTAAEELLTLSAEKQSIVIDSHLKKKRIYIKKREKNVTLSCLAIMLAHQVTAQNYIKCGVFTLASVCDKIIPTKKSLN